VPKAKEHEGVMPPMGGARLSSADVTALAQYVWHWGIRPRGEGAARRLDAQCFPS
jgi:hypothetical protein